MSKAFRFSRFAQSGFALIISCTNVYMNLFIPFYFDLWYCMLRSVCLFVCLHKVSKQFPNVMNLITFGNDSVSKVTFIMSGFRLMRNHLTF